MVQSLCYDVFSINDWQLLLEMIDDFYQKNIAKEDDYNQLQFLFSSLLENVPHDLVQEVFRQMPNIKQPQEPKQKYELNMSYAKKALDLAIQINKVKEFVSYLKNFIEEAKNDLLSTQNDTEFILIGDLLHIPHKG
ncbi:7968_t:CDS:2 [Cetraspora pellucida]|uniref:7968_t:CDS:1 n=1 Tax=Cetraspora pellucida TaxID=1433469 RepID=A0A9N8VJR1_9GLOM|nr:7968_t:CDS:2 [Cetraspora pellucida]